MARPTDPSAAANATPESLDLAHFAEPDDQGISLDELSQAYAALLKKGDDPYSAPPPESPTPQVELPAELESAAEGPIAAEADFEITPRAIVEAILFVGHPTAEPLTSERIAALMRGVQPSEIDEIVSELNAEYEVEGAPYTVISAGAGYQLVLRPQYAALRDAFYGRIREARLSQAAIDVLAIVAYHQPVAGEVIDRLRGKPSGAIVSQLLRRDLISVERQAGTKGKPRYRTTGRFLEIFGLDGLSDLPQSQEISRLG